jgi:hypothetical protein
MQWPLKWFMPMQVALNTYDTLTTVNRAIDELEGDALDRWNRKNARLVKAALSIQRLRDELENAENDG